MYLLIQFLKDNYNIYSRNALSKLLNQTTNNVRVKLLELGLTNKMNRKSKA